jgi:hypothetical protein
MNEQKMRERIEDLNARVEELRKQRDQALHDLWKTRLERSYWRGLAKRLKRRLA